MKITKILAAVLLAGLVCAGPAAGADKVGLAKKQNSLNSEYSLAKDSNFYFVLDVLGRKLELRVRGMVLRSWPFQSMRFWGRPEFSGNVELVRKTALKAPKRIVIKPGAEAEKVEAAPPPAAKPSGTGAAPGNAAEFDLEALELKDMPKNFALDFDNGLHILVKVKTGLDRLSRALPGSTAWARRKRDSLSRQNARLCLVDAASRSGTRPSSGSRTAAAGAP